VSAWAAEQPCTRPSTREQTPSEEDQVADGLREPCAAEEGPNSGAGEAETVTAALIAQSLASGLASIEHGAAPRVTAAMAEEAQHWSDGPCEGDVHLAPEEDKEVDSQRTQIPSLATTSTTTTKTTTKTTTTGGAVPATQEHLQAEAHLGSPGDTAMLLAPIQQDTAAQAESAGKLFSDGDRTKNGGRTESFCQEEPDRNLQDMEDSETVVAAWAYLEGIAAPGCGEDGIVCAPAERASCSSFATPSCSSSSIVDTGSQVAVGSDANLVGAECELAPTASSSADAVPSAFAHVPPLPPSAGTESSVAVESIPTTAPAPAPPAAPATTSSSTTNTASAPASCTGADAHVAARSSSQVLELLSGECVGEDAPRQPPARVAAIVEPQQSDSTPGAVASAAATACVEALRGACPSSDDSRGAKRVGGSLASTAAASDGPDQKRAKLSLCFRRSAPPAPAGAQRVFPLGDVNRVITECFNQNKPLHALKVACQEPPLPSFPKKNLAYQPFLQNAVAHPLLPHRPLFSGSQGHASGFHCPRSCTMGAVSTHDALDLARICRFPWVFLFSLPLFSPPHLLDHFPLSSPILFRHAPFLSTCHEQCTVAHCPSDRPCGATYLLVDRRSNRRLEIPTRLPFLIVV
jgi:hypothetical protein